MEAFLNFLWVLIAAVALGFWRTRWHREERKSRRYPLREWTAIGCALVLLFFVVSLTDDLHSEVLFFDECSIGRHSAACSHHAPPPGGIVHDSGAATPVRGFSLHYFERVGNLVAEESALVADIPRECGSGRAPPTPTH
jgi:hypothetical protein